MFKTISMFGIFILVVLSVSFCYADQNKTIIGNGIILTEQRQLSPFNMFECAGAFKVVITAGKKQQFFIKGDSNIIPLIKTEVREGKLVVFSDRSYSSEKEIELTINVKDIAEVLVDGAHTVTVDNISNPAFLVDINGAGEFMASGSTKHFIAKINGGATVLTEKLSSKKVDIDITGAGSAEIFAESLLNANITGSGTIFYKGHPEVNKQILGVGTVSKK